LRKMSLLVALLAVMLALLFVMAGCGNKTTVETPEGTAQVEQDGGTATYNQGDQSATVEQSTTAPTEAELGAPIYPGAEYNADNSASTSYSNGGASASTTTAEFVTNDSFSKVSDWYKSKLGDTGYIESGLAQWTVGDLNSGDYAIVHVEESGGQTVITIAHISGSIP
jgi:predicted small lipoprotein YifL